MSRKLVELRFSRKKAEFLEQKTGSIMKLGDIIYETDDIMTLVVKDDEISKGKKLIVSTEQKRVKKIIKEAEQHLTKLTSIKY